MKPQTAPEKEIFGIWRDVNPQEAFFAGLSDCAGKLLVPTRDNVEQLTKRINAATTKCDSESQRKLLHCLETYLSILEPSQVPGYVLDTFFAHMVKEGIKTGHMLSLAEYGQKALNAYLEQARSRDSPLGQKLLAAIRCSGLLEVLNVVRSQTKSKALRHELGRLAATANVYEKHFHVNGFASEAFDEVWAIIRNRGCELGREKIYDLALRNLYDYHESPTEVENKGLRFLGNELSDYKELVEELAGKLGCEPRSEAVAQTIRKQKSLKQKRVIPYINKIRRTIIKIVNKRLVGVNPKYSTKVVETPRYLSGVFPSGGAFFLDYLTRNPRQLFLATTDPRRDPHTVPAELMNLLIHEEYGHCLHASNSALQYGAKPAFAEMLGSTLGNAISEGISFQRELEFLDYINGIQNEGHLTNDEKAFMRMSKSVGGFETLRHEYEFFTKTWRMTRFLRVIGDARINSGKQGLADFIEWANKETGLSRSMVYFQVFPAHQGIGPGYATTYAIVGEGIREIQGAAENAGKDLVKFNTVASSLGFPPRTAFESKLWDYVKS